MKKAFFDCKFTGRHRRTSLISIGFVTETGETFYAELNDFEEHWVDNWTKENVVSKLKFSAPGEGQNEHWKWSKKWVELRGNRDTVETNLFDWFQILLGGPVSWIDYTNLEPPKMVEEPGILLVSDCLAYDKVLLDGLFGGTRELPPCIFPYPLDLFDLFVHAGYTIEDAWNVPREEFAGVGKPGKHNALHDAIVIKKCWEQLLDIERRRR